MKTNNVPVNKVIVLNINGNPISTMYANRALKYIYRKEAEVVSEEPLTIRLLRAVKHNEDHAND